MTSEAMVMIAPLLVYSQKLSFTPCRPATSATIKFATEPSRVKFPARVDEAARVSQPEVGLGNDVTAGLSKSTAGTFETRFDSTTVIAARAAAPLCRKGFKAAKIPSVR